MCLLRKEILRDPISSVEMKMENKTKKSKKSCIVIPAILAALGLLLVFLYYMLFQSNFANFGNFSKSLFGSNSVCSNESNATVLLVGIDYRAGDYLYGLADVIRVAEVDFDNQNINMVAIPRDLLVEIPPERFKVPGPYKINQAYFFGTPGMLNYYGEGNGADSLNEVIEYNFGVRADHYLVINFFVFVDFINAIGGVDINLPEAVYGGSQGDFPAGEQTLTGERALALSRIRENYSDAFRVRNQSLIIRATFEKMLQPSMLLKSPLLIAQFKDSILTDLPLDQLGSIALCFHDFDSSNLQTHEPPEDLLTLENIFLPSLNEWSYGYRWDGRFVEWIDSSLNNPQQ
ncbi:MAG: LCP family protein [Anaerolineaceae bacterium]|nr:LCP family protein [Anaerolineaceae bacterium]